MMETKYIVGIVIGVIIILVVCLVIYFFVIKKNSSNNPSKWVTTDWQPPCDCGDCTQTRTVTCTQGENKVDDSTCTDAKPPSERTIQGPPCEYNWTEGDPWDDKDCKTCIDDVCKSKVCGNFFETKSNVNCIDKNGKIVPDSFCKTKKIDSKSCELPDCVFSWKAGLWNLPSTYVCGTGTISRSVSCIRMNDGSVTFDSNCKDIKPSETRVYPDKENYPDDHVLIPCSEVSGWFTSGWKEDCKTTAICGTGKQTRDVVCKKNGEIVNPPDSTICPDTDKPQDNQNCDTNISCDCCGVNKPVSPAFCSCEWDVSDWTPASCANPDFSQLQTRTVTCKNQDKTKVVDEGNCKSEKPPINQYCNPGNPIMGDGFVLFNYDKTQKVSTVVESGTFPFDITPTNISLPIFPNDSKPLIDLLFFTVSGTVYSGTSVYDDKGISFPLVLEKGDKKIQEGTKFVINFQTRDSSFTVGVNAAKNFTVKLDNADIQTGGIGMRIDFN